MMLDHSELIPLGIPVRPIKKSNSKSIAAQVPLTDAQGIIQWVDPIVLEKALDIKERTLDIQGKAREIQARQENAVKIHNLSSYIVDPYDQYEYSQFGQIRGKRNLDFDVLRRMGDTEIPAAIISTRIAQAIRFCKPTDEGLDELGYHVRLRDRREKASEEDKKRIDQIEQFIYKTGWEDGYVGIEKRDTLKKFVTKIVRDRLTFDKVNIELERIRKGDISAFFAVDATTIYPVIPPSMKEIHFSGMATTPYHDKANIQGKEVSTADIAYVQRVYHRDTAYFLRNEMLNICENPRTDIRFYGYGVSELELLMRAVTAWINGLTFSTSTFNENRLPSGLLSIVGNWNTDELQQFKDEFYLSMQNPAFKHRIPIMRTKDGKGVSFVNFKGQNSTSEEQQRFLTFMAQICGALFRIDVEEIGFQAVRMGAAPLTQASPLDKIKSSKDKGFEPLMEFLQDIINNEILNEIDDGKYYFEWIGLKEDRAKEKLEIRKSRLESGSTVRQLIKENDEDEPEGEFTEWMDAPANPVLFQAWQAEKMAKAQSEQQMEMTPEGEEVPPEEAGIETPPGEKPGAEGTAPETGGRFKPTKAEGEMGKSLDFTIRRVNDRLNKSVSNKT